MSEKQKHDQQQVEWSFDFGQLGESLKGMFQSLAGDEALRHYAFSAPLGNARQAKLDLEVSVGRGMLHSIHDEHLIVVDMETVGEAEFEAHEGETAYAKFHQPYKAGWNLSKPIQQSFRAIAQRQDLMWNIGVSAKVPLDLKLHSGVGAVQADLSSLILSHLEIDGGVGTLKLSLPPQAEPYEAEVDCGVGAMSIYIPQGANLTLKLDGGVGATEIVLPASAAVRLEADSGLGSVKVPQHFERIEGKGNFIGTEGVWQTANYASATERVLICYDGGIGGLSVYLHPEA